MNNQELLAMITDLAKAIDLDPHGGVRDLVLRKLIETKIINAMPETALNPSRPLPQDWTALQVALFDNGDQVIAQKRKRYIKTKSGTRIEKLPRNARYGGNLKVWTRKVVNFSSPAQVAWNANFYLWDHTIANQMAECLLAELFIDQATVDLMAQCVANQGDTLSYAIPVVKDPSSGTRYLRGHIMMMKMDEGKPTMMGLIYPDGQLTADQFDVGMANGAKLKGNVIAQARVARIDEFSPWATEMTNQ